MSHQPAAPNPKDNQPPTYALRIKGHLGEGWSEWFGGMEIILLPDGDTLLIGPVRDQSELHGLLKRVRDLGMPLVSVNRVEDSAAPPESVDE